MKPKMMFCECGAPRQCKCCGGEYFVKKGTDIICCSCGTASWLANHHYPACTCKDYTEERWYKELQEKYR